eukprot:gene14194-25851_t
MWWDGAKYHNKPDRPMKRKEFRGKYGQREGVFGWKHDFVDADDWKVVSAGDMMVVVFRDASTWLPALARDTYAKPFYYHPRPGVYVPNPAVTAATLLRVIC